jgi:hypothetical protein
MSRRISTVDTAKEIRKALKHNFPGVKFSVRSKSYSGGSSIRVCWTDGPKTRVVDKVVKRYEGASFDGMVDLKSYHDDVISHEDGSTEVVHWGADFVFTERDSSPETELALATDLAKVIDDDNYISHGNITETDPASLVKEYNGSYPVFVTHLHIGSEDRESYFALHATERNDAPTLIRQLFNQTDLYTEKAAV